MRIIMAVSADGFVARGPDDDMSWTGPEDKALFKSLTSVGGVCAAGSTTYSLMPDLPGRRLLRLSRSGHTLVWLAGRYPEAWIIGGLTVVLAALGGPLRMVDEVHLSRIPKAIGKGVSIKPLWKFLGLKPDQRIKYGTIVHEVYRI